MHRVEANAATEGRLRMLAPCPRRCRVVRRDRAPNAKNHTTHLRSELAGFLPEENIMRVSNS